MMHDPPLKASANDFERQDKIAHGQRDASRRNDSYNHGGGGFSNKEKSGGHSSDSATSGIKPPSEVWVKTLVFG
jgi:hypothetical protein